jgi:hypothetical protein
MATAQSAEDITMSAVRASFAPFQLRERVRSRTALRHIFANHLRRARLRNATFPRQQ